MLWLNVLKVASQNWGITSTGRINPAILIQWKNDKIGLSEEKAPVPCPLFCWCRLTCNMEITNNSIIQNFSFCFKFFMTKKFNNAPFGSENKRICTNLNHF